MSEIPKRPIFALYTDDATADLWLVHEHAVAKRAVEALKGIAGVVVDDLNQLEINHRYAVEDAREALAEIAASGWKPDAALQQGGQGEG